MKNNIDLGVLSAEQFWALAAYDETNVGTPAYLGIAFFWHHAYRHWMRDASFSERRRVHAALLAANYPVDGRNVGIERIMSRVLRCRVSLRWEQ